MKVLKTTLSQKKALEGIYKNGAELKFIQDAKNNWVVNDAVLFDSDFEEIKTKLQALPLIDYLPIENPTIWYMNKNILLFIENVAVWGGVIAAYAMAILPLVQVIAGLAAFVFSVLSIIRIIKNWHEKN